jgi:hypothetical protein
VISVRDWQSESVQVFQWDWQQERKKALVGIERDREEDKDFIAGHSGFAGHRGCFYVYFRFLIRPGLEVL